MLIRTTIVPNYVWRDRKRPAHLLPAILIGLTVFLTTVMVETVYLVCHLWRCLFDGSALSFSWIEPLPVAGIYSAAVLLVAFFAARLMSRSSGDDA